MSSSFAPRALHAANPGTMTGAGNWTYLVAVSSGEALLIDAGVGKPEHLAALKEALSAAGATLSDVVVTHGHSDHVSGIASIVAAHPEARASKMLWPDEDARWPVKWRPLADGDVVKAGSDELQVVHTPGHAPDHVALLHEPSRTLFSGDLIIPNGSVVIQIRRGGDLRQYLASLNRLLALEPARLLPAHGAPVDRPAKVLSQAIEHRLERERQVVAALSAGHATVASITESIYHGLSPALLMLARENVRAHLHKLEAEGTATGVIDLRE